MASLRRLMPENTNIFFAMNSKYRQHVSSTSEQVAALFQQGVDMHRSGQLAQAWDAYGRVLKLEPTHFDSLHMMGLVAAQASNFTLALDILRKAIAVNPRSAEAHGNRGNVYLQLMQYPAALEDFDRTIQLKPELPESYSNRGNALKGLKRWEEALASYDIAISMRHDFAEAYCNRGAVCVELENYQAALDSLHKAIQIRPNFADAYVNMGTVLLKTRQYSAAVEILNKSIELNSNQTDAYLSLGVALANLSRRQEAIQAFNRVLQVRPNDFEGTCNRATVLYDLKQYRGARDDYAKAYAQKPEMPFLLGMLTRTRMFMCDWENFESVKHDLSEKIHANESVAHPLVVTAIFDSPALQKNAAEIFIKNTHPKDWALGVFNPRPRGNKIVIGYFSSDLRDHPVAYLMAELFELHDKSKFELIAFSLDVDSNDEMRLRISSAFDKFINVNSMSDIEIAKLSRELNVDIAIDLNGFTKGSRTNIFALRAAPIQVNYMGYAGTMGADYIDYIIADEVIIPSKNQGFYTEKIAYLPNSFQVNDRKRAVSNRIFKREDVGLPAKGFVFSCFNGSYKINPDIFDRWMKILLKVEGSVLWLRGDNEWAAENMKLEAEKRGVSSKRLVFTKYIANMGEFLASQRLSDLFIDTLPYNAHTTASDALWAGLPVVTCIGNSFAGRVAASLLSAIGLPELITETLDEYEALIVSLAKEPDRLSKIMDRLNDNRLTSPLFDSPTFVKNIESIYFKMYERSQSGLVPEHIYT